MSPRQKEPITYEHALIGFVLPKPLHAYALHRALSASPIGKVWHVKQSALYAMTLRLEADGLLSFSDEEPTQRGKRLMHCTPAGQAAFAQWCSSVVSHPRDIRMDFLAKLYFVQMLHPELRAQLFADQLAECEQWLIRHRVDPGNDRYLHAVEQFRMGQIRAIIEWLRDCESLVKN
jgi:PadR family transcriptional regulator AphA